MTKSKSTHAGRMAVLDFLREEGIQIVPVPHGDRKTGGQIVVMLGDGTWLEFDTQKQVVDWLAEHMERRGVKVHNPSKSSAVRHPVWYKKVDGEYHLTVEKPYDETTTMALRDIKGMGPYPSARMASLSAQEVNRRYRKSRSSVSDLTAAGMRGHDSSPWGADASRQRSRRNPSSGKAFWWLIITRDDETAVGHRYESRESMMHYSKKHAANLRGDNSKALIRGTEPMTTAAFRKAFKTAYPKFTLEV